MTIERKKRHHRTYLTQNKTTNQIKNLKNIVCFSPYILFSLNLCVCLCGANVIFVMCTTHCDADSDCLRDAFLFSIYVLERFILKIIKSRRICRLKNI